MYSGRVSCGPIVKNVTTNSSIERVTLSRAPAKIAGAMSGSTMWRRVWRGDRAEVGGRPLEPAVEALQPGGHDQHDERRREHEMAGDHRVQAELEPERA